MGWDAYLHDDRGHQEGDWNYTFNTSRMVYAVLEDEGYEYEERNWFSHLDGMTGAEGAEFLGMIIRGMEADPDRFRALNPENGWGDYDTFLKEMHHESLKEWPTVWSASG